MYRRGDVVIVAFPFTDASATKARPAVVISADGLNNVTDDVLIAAITSREPKNQYECKLTAWEDAGLVKPSTVCAKIATVHTDRINHRPGRLQENDCGVVGRLLRRALDL